MKKSQITRENYRLKTPKISNDFFVQWEKDWWDGFQKGIAISKNQYVFYEMIEENEKDEDLTNWYRNYIIINITDIQLSEEKYWQEKYITETGNYQIDFRRIEKPEIQINEEQTKIFYEEYQKFIPNYENNEIIGWISDKQLLGKMKEKNG